MLRGIPRNISPDLMHALMQMGHGDEIVFADANFPAESMGKRVIYCVGDTIPNLLKSILPLFPLDTYDADNAALMEIVAGKGEKPEVWEEYRKLIIENDKEEAFGGFTFVERFAFYERAKKAFVIVSTGEKAKYTNIILKLGVVE